VAYNTKALLLDVNGKPIPQYYNPTIDDFEAITGANGSVDNSLTGSSVTQPQLYNGATYDPEYNNAQGTLLASAVRTASTSSPTITNYNGKGLLISVTIDATSGTSPTLQAQLLYTDPISGQVTGLTSVSPSMNYQGVFLMVCYPSQITQSGSGSGIITNWETILPRTFQVQFTVGGTTPSITFSASYTILNN